MTPFRGHAVNAGHLLQPATSAIGHRVMVKSSCGDVFRGNPFHAFQCQYSLRPDARIIERRSDLDVSIPAVGHDVVSIPDATFTRKRFVRGVRGLHGRLRLLDFKLTQRHGNTLRRTEPKDKVRLWLIGMSAGLDVISVIARAPAARVL